MESQYIRVRVVIQDKNTKEVYPMMEDFALSDNLTWEDIRKDVINKYTDTEFDVITIGYKEIKKLELVSGQYF